jgi:hypothetical protein
MRSHLEKEPFFANKIAIQKANSLQQADLRVAHSKKFGLPQPPRCGSSTGSHIRLGSSSKIHPPPPTILLGAGNSFAIPSKQASKESGIQPVASVAMGSKLPLKDITQMILMNQTKDASTSKHQGQKGVKYSKLLSH